MDRNSLLDSLMRSQIIVEVHIFPRHSVQLLLLQNKHVVQTLSLQAANEPFANSICPRRLDRRFQFFDPSASGNGRKETAVLLVPISNQVFGSLSPCGRFPQLLRYPSICWVPGHNGVDNTAPLEFNDDVDNHACTFQFGVAW